jgi:hypothetical protein
MVYLSVALSYIDRWMAGRMDGLIDEQINGCIDR